MAKSEKLKQMRAEQLAAAHEVFEAYKQFIAEEFVNAFGGSYETAKNLPTDWRKYFAYKAQCEEFLIDKTKTFIHVRTPIENKYQSPVFLKNLTALISEYLATYTVQKGWSLNECKKYLRTQLFDNNHHVQLEIQRYTRRNEQAWSQEQQKRRKTKERKRIKATNAELVEISKEEAEKLHKKQLRRRIMEKKKELGIPVERDYTLTVRQAAVMLKKYEANIKIFVSINGNSIKR